MELLKKPIRNSSTKIDSIVCQVDLSSSKSKKCKIVDNDYLQALKNHSPIRESKSNDDLSKIQYDIDKVVRQTLKKGLFGYNNSKLINLHKQFNKKSQSFANDDFIIEKLKQKIDEKPKGIPFEYWLLQKEAEDRIKNRLKMKILKKQHKFKLVKEHNKLKKCAERQLKVQNWLTRKKKEAKKKEKIMKKDKHMIERIQKDKENKAQEEYSNWLNKKIQMEKEKEKSKKIQKKEQKAQMLEVDKIKKN
ncbi:hypothetical protein SteCoe_8871 [Stentor coeruleus]|uniref:Uncharacterized protein n=1 Tax=Stentor coeruleus TaxID=5963 RepID=A0A1R2CJ62_9CILI|nr:hypothetical protein SteCoe_8871 [Stentor coeruleus]